MALKFVDIYNAVAEQAWSMYDADAETIEDFESGLKSSINKALTELWCSYDFPFRVKEYVIRTKKNKNKYTMPTGIIYKKQVNGEQTYSVRIGQNFLQLADNLETIEPIVGKPDRFEVYNDNFLINTYPDDDYEIIVEYLELAVGIDENSKKIYELAEDEDQIVVPEKFEKLFKNALITKSMLYAIADKTDENYAGYEDQYENAYKTLVRYSIGLEKDKRIII